MQPQSTPSTGKVLVPKAVAETPKARRNGRATTRQAKAQVSPEPVVGAEPELVTNLNSSRPDETLDLTGLSARKQVDVLKARITELEAEVERLRAPKARAPRQPKADKSGPWGDPIPGVGARHYALMTAHWPAQMPVLDAIEHLLGELDRLVQAGTITKADRGHMLFGLRKHLARERGETDYLSPRFRQADAQPSTKGGDR